VIARHPELILGVRFSKRHDTFHWQFSHIQFMVYTNHIAEGSMPDFNDNEVENL